VVDELRQRWDEDGFVRVPGFLSTEQCAALLDAGTDLLHTDRSGVVMRTEQNFPADLPIAQRISKLYRLHDREPFRAVSIGPAMLDVIRLLIPGDIDVFLSQLVWKLPGASGQPWHQDASIFPFEPATPIVGTWIALTDADESTSCLRFARGSHHRPVLVHTFEDGHGTRGRYLQVRGEEVDHARSVVVTEGDLIVFDSQVLHMSTDNRSHESRIAFSLHYATAGTTDRTAEVFGQSPYNYWLPAYRTP
jgi:ectoine hydroxylase-related dioxygenase (phytanoyl-CoA dioxygenase family)